MNLKTSKEVEMGKTSNESQNILRQHEKDQEARKQI